MGHGGFSSYRIKTQRSSIAHKRLRQLLSELPPTNFSIQPHILETSQRVNFDRHDSAYSITKSWIPTTMRCSAGAHQRPRLRHVIEGGPYNNPSPLPNNHFLGDSANIAEALFDEIYVMPYASSYWCILKSDTNPKSHPPPTIPSNRAHAMSLQGALVVMQVLDTRLKITAVGGVRAVPSVPSRFFKEYLVEMNGEILMVFLIHEKSLALVDNVEVFRLDLDKLDWIKVERMRGKTMFLKEKCVWVDSAEFGCRDNCVFFTQGINGNSWRVYDIKTCCISSV